MIETKNKDSFILRVAAWQKGLKADELDSLKKFCTQSPSKFQHLFFGQKLTDVPIWSTSISSNL